MVFPFIGFEIEECFEELKLFNPDIIFYSLQGWFTKIIA